MPPIGNSEKINNQGVYYGSRKIKPETHLRKTSVGKAGDWQLVTHLRKTPAGKAGNIFFTTFTRSLQPR
jgi:hypothetical protein